VRARALLAAVLLLPAVSLGVELGPVRISGLGYAEYRSAYYSRGTIVNKGPVLPLLGQAVGSFGKFGYIGGSAFAMSSLTSGCQSADRRNAFNEVDLKAYYGYDWDFGNGWALGNTVGYQWALWPGYHNNPPVRHEWQIGQGLMNPYVMPYYLWRHAFEGAKWNYWQVGLTRAFSLGRGFVLKPKFWCDFGDERLFKMQYGQPCTDGLMALNCELRLEWWFMDNFGIHVAVQQFDVVSHAGREALDESPKVQATTDLTIFTAGLTARF